MTIALGSIASLSGIFLIWKSVADSRRASSSKGQSPILLRLKIYVSHQRHDAGVQWQIDIESNWSLGANFSSIFNILPFLESELV